MIASYRKRMRRGFLVFWDCFSFSHKIRSCEPSSAACNFALFNVVYLLQNTVSKIFSHEMLFVLSARLLGCSCRRSWSRSSLRTIFVSDRLIIELPRIFGSRLYRVANCDYSRIVTADEGIWWFNIGILIGIYSTVPVANPVLSTGSS